MSLRQFWNYRCFWNFGIFKWPFLRNGQKYWQFLFVIFGQVDVFFILVEFEVDGMRPNECTKNGRKSAHGLNCNFCQFRVLFSKYTTKISQGKNISCFFDDFEFFASYPLETFWYFWPVGVRWGDSIFSWRDRARLKELKKSFRKCAEVRRFFQGQKLVIKKIGHKR